MKVVSWIDSMDWEDKKNNPSRTMGVDAASTPEW
jgi:hypothetical protein